MTDPKSIPVTEAIVPAPGMPGSETKPVDQKPKEEGWRSVEEVKEIIREREEARKKNRDMASRLAELEAEKEERSRKEAQSASERERQKLEAEGQYQQALESFKKNSTAQIDEYRSKVTNKLIPNAIKAAVAQVGNVSPEVARDIPRLLSDRVRLNHDSLDLEVVGEDGKPMMDADLKPVSVEAFVKEFVAARPYMLLDRQAPGTGLKPGPLKGDAGSWDMDRALADHSYASQWQKSDPDGYALANASYWTPEKMLAKARKSAGLISAPYAP
jgi:hypothetical protein